MGEYTVNVHMFRNETGRWPIKVGVMVSVKKRDDEPAIPILRTNVSLVREDQEVTVYRFELNEAGGLLLHTINHIYKPLREADSERL